MSYVVEPRAVELPDDLRAGSAGKMVHRLDDGEVLVLISFPCPVARIVRRGTHRHPIDPELSVVVDRVAADGVARPPRAMLAEDASARR
jgi:hypothetical protein